MAGLAPKSRLVPAAGAWMTEPSGEQFGGVLAAPTPRQRRGDIAALAGAALAVALARVALTIAIHRAPPRGLIANAPSGQVHRPCPASEVQLNRLVAGTGPGCKPVGKGSPRPHPRWRHG